ncbi:MAG: class A beta-lactamase-related serine hydrolase, partial [Chitinophagia bacterium]|nr:class A beta-lactamase-related serine hydrolase [Chitinophagia bacterium]
MRSAFIIATIALACALSQASAKEVVDSNANNLKRLKKWYNSSLSDSIYSIMDESFTRQYTRGRFDTFLTQVKSGSGNMTAIRLLSFRDGLSTYKVRGEKDTAGFYLMLATGDRGQIAYLMFTKEAPATENKKPFSKVVDSLTHRYISRVNTVGLSVGIINGNKISTYHYGEVVKGKQVKPDDNTIYEWGSLTKTFTATLIAALASDNKLKLNDPLTKYLPEPAANNPALKEITLLMLLIHTSGLGRMPDNFYKYSPDTLNPFKVYSKANLLEYLATCTTESKPGSKFGYSNVGFAVLGLVAERVSGISFEKLLTKTITGPLGMKNTYTHLDTAHSKQMAAVYNESGDLTPAWDFEAFTAAGSLRGSVHDLLLWMNEQMKMNGKTGKAIQTTHTINMQPEPLCPGWFVARGGKAGEEVDIFWHNGGTG